MHEHKGFSLAGIPMIGLALLLLVAAIWLLVTSTGGADAGANAIAGIVLVVATAIIASGFFQVAPNEARVLQLFGKYAGSVRDEGLRWTNPLCTKRRLSLRVRNFESGKLKVNDLDGNPIEIAAVVVWQVVDSAEAVFCVDDYENFVHIQSESALRQMAQSYPYDAHTEGQAALRSHGEEITAHLRDQIQERLGKAGVEVTEARISHLAYAQEIAQAMLQRQQAGAIIDARTRIVEGAVSMVGMALDQLKAHGVVELDEERKAAMVSNLLVVLCGERGSQPVLNAGSLY